MLFGKDRPSRKGFERNIFSTWCKYWLRRGFWHYQV